MWSKLKLLLHDNQRNMLQGWRKEKQIVVSLLKMILEALLFRSQMSPKELLGSEAGFGTDLYTKV